MQLGKVAGWESKNAYKEQEQKICTVPEVGCHLCDRFWCLISLPGRWYVMDDDDVALMIGRVQEKRQKRDLYQ